MPLPCVCLCEEIMAIECVLTYDCESEKRRRRNLKWQYFIIKHLHEHSNKTLVGFAKKGMVLLQTLEFIKWLIKFAFIVNKLDDWVVRVRRGAWDLGLIWSLTRLNTQAFTTCKSLFWLCVWVCVYVVKTCPSLILLGCEGKVSQQACIIA